MDLMNTTMGVYYGLHLGFGVQNVFFVSIMALGICFWDTLKWYKILPLVFVLYILHLYVKVQGHLLV